MRYAVAHVMPASAGRPDLPLSIGQRDHVQLVHVPFIDCNFARDQSQVDAHESEQLSCRVYIYIYIYIQPVYFAFLIARAVRDVDANEL
jgi:hypothetical protein